MEQRLHIPLLLGLCHHIIHILPHTGEGGEIGLHIRLGLRHRHADVLTEGKGGDAVDDTEVHGFRPAAHLVGHIAGGHMEHLGRRGVQIPEVQLLQRGGQHSVQGVHGAGVAVEGSLRRRHIPQQGEGIRFQMNRLYQLRVEIPSEQLTDFIFAAGGVHQIGGQSGVEHEALCV